MKGEQSTEAKKHAEEFVSLEKELAKAELSPEDYYDKDKTYNAKDWWTEKDHQKFNEKCQRIVGF